MSSDDKLAKLAYDAGRHPMWQAYAEYLRLRGIGLRRDALATLNGFIETSAHWPFEEKLRFAQWIARQNDLPVNNNNLLPPPLIKRWFAATVDAYLAQAPDSSEAHFLCAMLVVCAIGSRPPGTKTPNMLDLLERAVELDPGNAKARKAFIEWTHYFVEGDQHELPWGYIGAVDKDLGAVETALAMLPAIAPSRWRDEMQEGLTQFKAAAEAWQAYKSKARTVDFADWCIKNGGPAHLLQQIERSRARGKPA